MAKEFLKSNEKDDVEKGDINYQDGLYEFSSS